LRVCNITFHIKGNTRRNSSNKTTDKKDRSPLVLFPLFRVIFSCEEVGLGAGKSGKKMSAVGVRGVAEALAF